MKRRHRTLTGELNFAARFPLGKRGRRNLRRRKCNSCQGKEHNLTFISFTAGGENFIGVVQHEVTDFGQAQVASAAAKKLLPERFFGSARSPKVAKHASPTPRGAHRL